jgi:hypothetical protein
MKRPIKTFADLRAAIAEIAAETPAIAQPPMTTAELRDQARAFVEYRRTARDDCLAPTPPRPDVVAFKPSPGPPLTR